MSIVFVSNDIHVTVVKFTTMPNSIPIWMVMSGGGSLQLSFFPFNLAPLQKCHLFCRRLRLFKSNSSDIARWVREGVAYGKGKADRFTLSKLSFCEHVICWQEHALHHRLPTRHKHEYRCILKYCKGNAAQKVQFFLLSTAPFQKWFE